MVSLNLRLNLYLTTNTRHYYNSLVYFLTSIETDPSLTRLYDMVKPISPEIYKVEFVLAEKTYYLMEGYGILYLYQNMHFFFTHINKTIVEKCKT